MPWFATFAMLFFMANAGLPGTSGFVGEFMVILSAFQRNPWIALGAATTLIIGAAYTLWLYKRIFFGEVANSHVAELKDINGREWLVLGVFAIGVLALDRIQQAAVIPGFDDDHLAAAAIDRR
uniref:NADH-ubiquinone oxidoreductase chain 4 n=1 Tax=Panagrolaimus superbus TaxID=310955 RepID=A0A914YBH8_9BILA